MTNLSDAIQLIHQGRKEQARLLLEAVLKTDPKNIQAWFWYVETISSLEKRIQVLEVCLKVNPGNPQVTQALSTLRAQQPALTQTSAFDATYPAADTPALPKVNPFTSSWKSESFAEQPASLYDDEGGMPAANDSEPDYYDPTFADPEPVYSYVEDADADLGQPKHDGYPQPSTGYKPAFDWDALEKETAQKRAESMQSDSLQLERFEPGKKKTAEPGRKKAAERARTGKSYPFYQVWLMALFPVDIGTYASMLDDPEATAGRAFEWTAITSVIVGLVVPFYIFFNPAFKEALNASGLFSMVGNEKLVTTMSIFMVVMAIMIPITSVLGLAINGALLNFLAAMFGGNGNFQRTTYALGAFTAPFLLISTAISMVPVLQFFTPFLGIYSFICNIRALMAAHEFSTWDAVKTMLAPTVLIFILGCILSVVLMITSR